MIPRIKRHWPLVKGVCVGVSHAQYVNVLNTPKNPLGERLFLINSCGMPHLVNILFTHPQAQSLLSETRAAAAF